MANSIKNNIDKNIPLYITDEPTHKAEEGSNKSKISTTLITLIGNEDNAGISLAVKKKPEIDSSSMDPDTAIIILMNAFNEKSLNDINTASQLLKSNNKFTGELNKEKLIKLKDQIAKIEEEAKKKKEQQTASDIGLGFSAAAAIFAFIGALAFTVVTGGLGGPALVGASIGLTMSVLDVGTRIANASNWTYKDGNKEDKPLDFTLGGMVKRIVEQIAIDDKNYPPGSTNENREKMKGEIIMAVTLALNIGISVACIALSVVSLKTLSSAGKKIADAADDVAKGAIKETSKEATQELAKGTIKEVGSDAAKNIVNDSAKNAAKNMAKDAAKDITKDSTKTVAKDTVKDTAKNSLLDKAKNLIKGKAKNSEDDVSKITDSRILKSNAQMLGVVTNILETTTEIGNSAMEVALGIMGMQLAGIVRENRQIEIDISSIESTVQMVKEDITSNQDLIKELIETNGKLYEDFSDALSNYYQSQSRTFSKA